MPTKNTPIKASWLKALAAATLILMTTGAAAKDTAQGAEMTISTSSGTVLVHGPSETSWRELRKQGRMRAGTGAWIEQGSRALIKGRGVTVTLEERSHFEFKGAPDIIGSINQGSIMVNVGASHGRAPVVIMCPRGLVKLQGPGEYRVFAGDRRQATSVLVIKGEAGIGMPSGEQVVQAGNEATISGTEDFRANIGPRLASANEDRSGAKRETTADETKARKTMPPDKKERSARSILNPQGMRPDKGSGEWRVVVPWVEDAGVAAIGQAPPFAPLPYFPPPPPAVVYLPPAIVAGPPILMPP